MGNSVFNHSAWDSPVTSDDGIQEKNEKLNRQQVKGLQGKKCFQKQKVEENVQEKNKDRRNFADDGEE